MEAQLQRMISYTCEDGEGLVRISSMCIEAIIYAKESHEKYLQCTVTFGNEHYVIKFHYRYFSVLKHCILISLCGMAKKFCTPIFMSGLPTSFSFIQNSYHKM